MKERLLEFLVCPNCHSELALRIDERQGQEIIRGNLRCVSCNRDFSIIGAIPRMINKYGRIDEQTARSFGYEWKTFSELDVQYEQQFLDWIYPVERSFFQGKIILDAGCGKGRHLALAGKFRAKEVIGVDLSDAVEVAYANTKNLPNVHVIQADICNLPLKKVFDYVYCVGVLHHLSRPQEGLRSLQSVVRSGGVISLWVYGRENNGWIVYLLDPVRKYFTSRLSPAVIKKIAWCMAFFIVYPLIKIVYHPDGTKFRPLKNALFYNDYFCYISRFRFREIYSIIFDFLSPPVVWYLRKEEVFSWFVNGAFSNPQILWHNKNSWKVLAKEEVVINK